MNDVITRLHREAMDFADEASAERRSDHPDRALELTRRAFELESAAAHGTEDRPELEPTRSVLHRSAASLALECGELREAERLIARALAGNPPDEIAEELRDLLEDVYFQRHLSLRRDVRGEHASCEGRVRASLPDTGRAVLVQAGGSEVDIAMTEKLSPNYSLTDPAMDIYVGDFREILGKLSSGGVKADLIFADPPFNCRQDYAGYDDDSPEGSYGEFTIRWLYECVCALSASGSIWVNIPDRWVMCILCWQAMA